MCFIIVIIHRITCSKHLNKAICVIIRPAKFEYFCVYILPTDVCECRPTLVQLPPIDGGFFPPLNEQRRRRGLTECQGPFRGFQNTCNGTTAPPCICPDPEQQCQVIYAVLMVYSNICVVSAFPALSIVPLFRLCLFDLLPPHYFSLSPPILTSVLISTWGMVITVLWIGTATRTQN